MSFKVLIYSSQPIVEIGLSFCVKKCLPNATILKTNTLDFLSSIELNSNCDLFIFDVFHLTEMNFIDVNLLSFFKEKKVIFLIENMDIEKLLEYKNITYIYRNSSELEIVRHLRTLCKKSKLIIRYKRVTKRIQKKIKFSQRERECADLLMKGYSVSQISKELAIEMNTISTYKMRILKKTNTNNLVQLINTLYKLKH